MDYVVAQHELIKRLIKGEVTFRFGPSNWNPGWYQDPYNKVSLPLAIEVAVAIPSIKDFHIYYNNRLDEHYIRFPHQNDEYIIRWYKTFTLVRKSNLTKVSFSDRKHDIVRWLTSERNMNPDHPHWDKEFGNPFEFTYDVPETSTEAS